jgi:hypothetical protein
LKALAVTTAINTVVDFTLKTLEITVPTIIQSGRDFGPDTRGTAQFGVRTATLENLKGLSVLNSGRRRQTIVKKGLTAPSWPGH